MKHIIKHNKQREMLVPLIAISNNIEFIYTDRQDVEFNNGETAKIRSSHEVNILSEEGERIARNVYGIEPHLLLQKWYKVLGDPFRSLIFMHIIIY